MLMDGFKRSAVSVIIQFEDEFLLLKRSKFPYVGRYLPVGGKIEAFESPEDAARREAWEETGIHINQLKYRGLLVETSPHPRYNWTCFIFTSELEEKIEAPACDEGQLEWVKVKDLPQLDIPATDLPIYNCIADNDIFVFSATFDADLHMLEMHRLDQ